MEKTKQDKFRLSNKVGKPPGSLIYTGNQKNNKTEISYIQYNELDIEQNQANNLKEVFNKLANNKTTWINIDSLNDTTVLAELGALFGFHALLLEDILNVQQLHKATHFDTHIYCSMKMISFNPTDNTIDEEVINFVLGENYLISIQEKKGDVFSPIRKRIEESSGIIRKGDNSYLLYALIDIIIDNYFSILEHLEDKSTDMEEQLLTTDDSISIKEIIELKKLSQKIKKAIYPMRESIHALLTSESKFISESNKIYLTDVFDHVEQIKTELITLIETTSSLMDLHSSNQNTKMNEIMKTLTIVGSIFIPLTFIAGIYGMNFENMPELKIENGYFYALITMVFVGAGMFLFMKRKKYL